MGILNPQYVYSAFREMGIQGIFKTEKYRSLGLAAVGAADHRDFQYYPRRLTGIREFDITLRRLGGGTTPT
jgi:hypothetical protein